MLCTLHSKLEEVPADLSVGRTEVWNVISENVNSLLNPFRLESFCIATVRWFSS